MRRLIQVALLLLLLIHLGGPLFETVDHWDGFAQGGDDLVLNCLGMVAGLGLALLPTFLLRLILPPSLASYVLSLIVSSEDAGAFLEAVPRAPFTSPPLPLRI